MKTRKRPALVRPSHSCATDQAEQSLAVMKQTAAVNGRLRQLGIQGASLERKREPSPVTEDNEVTRLKKHVALLQEAQVKSDCDWHDEVKSLKVSLKEFQDVILWVIKTCTCTILTDEPCEVCDRLEKVLKSPSSKESGTP